MRIVWTVPILLSVGLLVGADGDGCISLPGDGRTTPESGVSDGGTAPVNCDPLPCRMDCAPQGLKKDAHGCDLCECAAPIACQSNDPCPEGARCDTVNFCDRPPGCKPEGICPAVCYGRCVVDRPGGGCVCTEQYEPVCGADDKTYPNECQAKCAGVEVASKGECGGCSIQCLVYEPVCGSDGVTYGCGEADATCHKSTVVHAGACGDDCSQGKSCKPGLRCVDAGLGHPECLPWGFCLVPGDCEQPETRCLTKDDCPDRFSCDTNVCLPPPGCDPADACATICFGLCVAPGTPSCVKNHCDYTATP